MIFIKILKNRNSKNFFLPQPYDVIFNFSCKNFNIKKNQFSLEQYNIINWLIKNKSSKKIILQCDNDFSYENGEIKISSIKNIVDNILVGLKDYKIFYPFLIFYFSTLKNLILFNWWNVVLFKDALEALCFKLSDVKFADNYYSIFTSNVYKPLWTYVVEKEKSKVELLTISSLTDIEHIDKSLKFDFEGIRVSTWNRITVWNEQSKKYITNRDISKKNNIKVLNSHIYYKDKNQKLDLPNFSVSAFTYENHRFNLPYSYLSDWVQSYSTDIFYLNKKFWNDLLLMKEKYDFTLVVKKKRDFPNKFDYKRNLKFNKWLKNQFNVIEVDNNFAIEKIIYNSDISISMPFTSPSIIAKYLKKKSIYYDPTSLIDINDPNSSGVEIISGKDNLDKFFNNYLKRKI
jgi:polysaccharide biosynthesis PFTS motif protein